SAGERALIAAAGATAADYSVRTAVDYDSGQIIRKNSSFVGKVLNFGDSSSDENGTPLDAEAEAQRLRDLETVQNATGGDPVIIRKNAGGFKLPGT
ncbi:MAG: hypothetical protein CMK07_10465, partial [Ponticaulis sp.]|nr:hypothetical protein [Ponticaulis sp.]